MKAKAIEVRDRATFIPVLCVDINPSLGDAPLQPPHDRYEAQRYLLRRCGYPCDGQPNILFTRLDGVGPGAHNDPYAWKSRTYAVAHDYIIKNWNTLKDGDVVDVEFILGETTTPKRSEREEFSV